MRKLTHLLVLVVSTLFFGMTAFAAPKTMPDGNVFDPQYYAAQHPDVNQLAAGNEDLLYAHYLNYGVLLGYLPYEGYGVPQVTTPANPVVTAQTAPPTVSNTKVTNSNPVASTATIAKDEINKVSPSASSGTVYLSATGSKYHSIPNCGRMNPNNARKVTISEAQNSGYGACSKCM